MPQLLLFLLPSALRPGLLVESRVTNFQAHEGPYTEVSDQEDWEENQEAHEQSYSTRTAISLNVGTKSEVIDLPGEKY